MHIIEHYVGMLQVLHLYCYNNNEEQNFKNITNQIA